MAFSPPSSPRARVPLRPSDATTEGVRLLRVILQRQTCEAVARRLGVDRTVVFRWATGERRPLAVARFAAESVLGISFESWDEPAKLVPVVE